MPLLSKLVIPSLKETLKLNWNNARKKDIMYIFVGGVYIFWLSSEGAPRFCQSSERGTHSVFFNFC